MPDELLIFSLWWTRLAKWHPMVPKVVPRGPKGYQNRATMPPKSFKIWCKSNKQCIWLCDCFGKQVFEEIIQFWFKTAPKGIPNWSLGQTWNLNSLFSPLGQHGCPSGAQWCPKWLQGCPKGAKMKLKCRPRSSKCGSKTSRKRETAAKA